MKRILVVDSDMAVRSQYTAVALCRQNAFDFVILAILLPELDGFSVCQTIRSFSQVPILILSECGDETDRIRGLELGADDYMVKPFSPRELMLRIAVILKRGPVLDSMRPQYINRNGISIDLTARRVTVDGQAVNLTPKEFDLLALLAGHPDVVFSRKKILDVVWGGELPEDTRTLDTHIKQVRHAIAPYRVAHSCRPPPDIPPEPFARQGFPAVFFFGFRSWSACGAPGLLFGGRNPLVSPPLLYTERDRSWTCPFRLSKKSKDFSDSLKECRYFPAAVRRESPRCAH